MIPASDGTIFNGHDVGSRAAIAAERALTISPDLGYSLHDVIDDSDALTTALSSPIAARLLLQGTIDGVRAALAAAPQQTMREILPTVTPSPAPGGTITDADMRRALVWLTAALSRPREAAGRPAGSLPGLLDYDLVAGDPVHTSAMMIALVGVGADILLATDQAHPGTTP